MGSWQGWGTTAATGHCAPADGRIAAGAGGVCSGGEGCDCVLTRGTYMCVGWGQGIAGEGKDSCRLGPLLGVVEVELADVHTTEAAGDCGPAGDRSAAAAGGVCSGGGVREGVAVPVDWGFWRGDSPPELSG